MIASGNQRPPVHVERLVGSGYVALILACVYFWNDQEWQDPILSLANVGILLLGFWPTLIWLKRHDASYPILELMLLTSVPFYALPILTNHLELAGYSEAALLKASLIVLSFQAIALLTSEITRHQRLHQRHFQASWWRGEIISEQRMQFTAYTATITTVWIYFQAFSNFIPPDLAGTLRAIFFGIGIISTFIQSRLWGSGSLHAGYKLLLCVNVVIQATFMFSSLLLINGIGLVLVCLAGYFSTSRRFPWLPILIVLPIVAILHNGKSQMRLIYWSTNAPKIQVTDLPEYFSRWVTLGLSKDKTTETSTTSRLTFGLMRRASLFHIVTIASTSVPDRVPFLDGETYGSIPSQIIPRFLWPDKPRPHESNKKLSTHLGILTERETEFTSIGFGVISEAYVNFGFLGVTAIGALFGYLLKRLAVDTMECGTISPVGLFRILCIVWCLSAETTLAVWISSLYQACIAVILPLWLLRYFMPSLSPEDRLR